MSSSKRHFTAVIGKKEQGIYVSSSPSSAARKVVSKLCADDKKRKVQFSIREITQSSDKKVYGPYIGYMQKLDKPIELKGRIIKYKPIAKLDKKVSKISDKKLKKQAAGAYPFVGAIITACRKTKIGHKVDDEEIIKFAEEQGKLKPKLLRQFKQSNVEAVRQLFEETFQNRLRAHVPHNPNNLFGQLRRAGRILGIEEYILNDYLKWYISQPRISEIAENPKQEDIKLGYERMLREISHGAFMFREVLDKGLSPATIGHKGFLELMQHKPPSRYIWAFNDCPRLYDIQKKMCFKRFGKLENISCFIAGMVFNPDGTIGFFKQSMRRNTVDPTHQIGLPVIVWPFRVGHYVYKRNTSGEVNFEKNLNSLYTKSGEFIGSFHGSTANAEARNQGLTGIVPRVADNLTHGDMDKILDTSDYYDASHEAMDKIGGISVFIDQKSESQEASEAKSNSNNNSNSAKHNPWGAADQ